MKQETLNKLLELAKKTVRRYEDDFMADDYAGGNIDDAWYGGMKDGERSLAQEILDLEGVEY
jgi:hypothetical protein